ncbi:MAG: ATP-binding protein [Candidatus Accumulibacter phosphatis]|uniref:ATP-binding protein n=1 Tax=Candidatus Accumulibacter sp. ACC012 TaxID=2823332 RepID=UPI0025C6586D|nr:ATP-binding protein [Candidatus Accumulibacter sp. ACC012]
MNNRPFLLEFSNRVIEHLGIKLYQNKPTNVISEFVSNSWDADASKVEIQLISSDDDRIISITDNGRGMTRDELIDEFLVIARNRRTHPSEKSAENRLLMGRKGIGKLAGFGIAKTVDIISVANPKMRPSALKATDSKCNWLRFSLDDIVGFGMSGKYKPHVIADNIGCDDFLALAKTHDLSSQLKSLISSFQKGEGGVCIRLFDTTIKKSINPDVLLKSLARRFTVTMLRPDFTVTVNAKPIDPVDALPSFHDFSIGTMDSPRTETVEINGKNREMKFWVRFVNINDSDWSIENAGIGIYAHGKIAQDRPFFFDLRGKEVYSRYVYGVVEADWIDQLDEDVVSTDRRSIDWETNETEPFHEWGLKKMGEWVSAYQKWRQSLPKKEIIEKIRAQKINLSGQEEEALAGLLSEVFVDLGNNEEAKEKAMVRIASAWTHEPTRMLTQSIWKEIVSTPQASPELLAKLLQKLKDSMVPEAMNLALTMAQRIGAITSMTKMIEQERTETHLQRLIEKFPWLIDPKNEFLTANQTLRTLVRKKHVPNKESGEWEIGSAEGRLKPDFVFLADPAVEREIVIYELKGPEGSKTLQPEEYKQLSNYLEIVSRVYNYEDIKITGILIGHEKGGIREFDNSITIKRWSDVLVDARHLHVTYLEALLQVSMPGKDDQRMQQIANFGGPEAIELLKRYSEKQTFPEEILSEINSGDSSPTIF